MKKILFTFICCVFSICTFADGPSCPVYGGEGAKVSLAQSVVKSNDKGEIWIQVKLTKSFRHKTNVLVNVTDADTDKVVNSELMIIKENFSVNADGTRGGYIPNHNYILSINNASCE